EVPLLDVVALEDDPGRAMSLMVINRDPERPHRAVVRLHNFAAQRGRARVLTGPNFMARNEWDRPDVVGLREEAIAITGDELTWEFPPHSVTELVLHR
ncbi:MAG: alpha-L-arabinofuranosidase C-terminal domain-containing protein, partial [Armatimonadota bacterium]|nr:alpha-L-arabinofuranosidase C-terminal domain-containing protein [Armatimonadota bacterium]